LQTRRWSGMDSNCPRSRGNRANLRSPARFPRVAERSLEGRIRCKATIIWEHPCRGQGLVKRTAILRSETEARRHRACTEKPTLVRSAQGDADGCGGRLLHLGYPDSGHIGREFPRLLRRGAPLGHAYYCYAGGIVAPSCKGLGQHNAWIKCVNHSILRI
jgi:hypothetical protein